MRLRARLEVPAGSSPARQAGTKTHIRGPRPMPPRPCRPSIVPQTRAYQNSENQLSLELFNQM